MRYPPEQVDRLAAEYVVGTLHGRARARFETLMLKRADVRFAVWQCERQLSGLAAGIQPVHPPRRVWREVRRRTHVPARVSRRYIGWLGLVTAGFAAAALVAWLSLSRLPTFTPDRLAVFSDDTAAALWVINTDLERGVIVTEAIDPPAGTPDTVFELWVLPASGNPRSMGLLETSKGTRETGVSAEALAVLPDAQTLAISIEPRGGSPTGLPTGPVVYQASLVRL